MNQKTTITMGVDDISSTRPKRRSAWGGKPKLLFISLAIQDGGNPYLTTLGWDDEEGMGGIWMVGAGLGDGPKW